MGGMLEKQRLLNKKRPIMRHLYMIPVMLIPIFLFACESLVGSGEDNPRERSLIFAWGSSHDFETIAEGTYGYTGIEDRVHEVISDEQAFVRLWRSLHGGQEEVPEPPEVDFDREYVVAALMGSRNTGGYATEIEDIAVHNGVTGIRVRERAPGPGCGTIQVLTHPYHLVKVSGEPPQEVSFEVYREVAECS